MTLLIYALPVAATFLLWLLFDPRREPSLRGGIKGRCAVIVPARNEEKNLPGLLASLPANELGTPIECIVVDDASSDQSAAVARASGAQVVVAPPLPAEVWTGKTWACHCGAQATQADLLLFLDADTRLESGGVAALLDHYPEAPKNKGRAFSVFPFYESVKPYEELSAFFIITMALGSSSFSRFGTRRAHLFGQSLLVDAKSYRLVGGHAAVRDRVLENFFLSQKFRQAGVDVKAILGKGLLRVRMFPEGLGQLIESWTKAFAAGAAATPPLTLALIIAWMITLLTPPTLGVLALRFDLPLFPIFVAYLGVAAHLYWLLRKLGNFSPLTALLYPFTFAFYQLIFLRSLKRSLLRQNVQWKGRSLNSQ